MATRPDMIGSTVRQVVAPALRECPPSCGIVTITRVEVSKDCSYATVYVSALSEPEAAVTHLEGLRDDFQGSLFHALSRSRVPKIRFRLDRTAEKASRVEKLLEESAEG